MRGTAFYFTAAIAQPELRPETVPEQNAAGQAGSSKQPQARQWRAVSEHFARVSDSIQPADSDICPVGNQAETGEETHEIRPWPLGEFEDRQQGDGQADTD